MHNRSTDERGFTVVDMLLTLVLAGVLIGVVVPKYQRLARETREAAVRAELANIRASINLFRILNKRNPSRLGELVEKRVLFPAMIGTGRFDSSFYNRTYLITNAVDGNGNVLDSFGNPFSYDPGKGTVRSTTEGFEAW